MVGVVFAVRGSSTTAHFSGGYKHPTELPSTKSITSDAGALSGNYINMTSAGFHSVVYSGMNNTPNGRAISVLMRMRPSYSGAPAAVRGLFSVEGGIGSNSAGFLLFHENTVGGIKIIGRKLDNNATFNNVSFGNWTTNVSGTYYDLVFTWDGTTGSNAGKFYIDNSLLGQLTASNEMPSTLTNYFYKSIAMGSSSGVGIAALGVDEFVIWDSVIDPSSVALVGGSGALNGASRSALVDISAYNGGNQYPRSRVVNA